MSAETDNTIDSVFAEIGEFGVFQVINMILLCLPSLMSGKFMVNYIFAAHAMDYRCKVPECDVGDNNREMSYNQPWLTYAIPESNNGFKNCFRYAPKNTSLTNGHQCGAENFDMTKEIKCSEFIYSSDETNIQTEFNIHCEDSYKLALVGTINNVGRFIFLPLTGLLSDKFGRLRVVVISMLCCSTFGLIKSFAVNYMMYIIFEFLEASAGTCIFGGIYVLGMEWVSSRYRALGTTLVCASFPLGEMLLGVIAMYVHDFRYLLRFLYVPGLFVIFYFWLVPESVRWLLINGQVDTAVDILKRVATVNRKTLSEKSIELLESQYSKELRISVVSTEKSEKIEDKPTLFQRICTVLRSRKLSLRLLVCCYLWMTCCFCYYGMSLISTHIPGKNRYISYIAVQAVEIPGAILPVLVLNKCQRRKLLFGALVLTGAATLLSPWVPQSHSIITLLLFMVGKAAVTFGFNILYCFTAELWPTNLRTTIMNSCSMTGRVGAMIAPLTTLLIKTAPIMPFLFFGCASIVGAVLALILPETHTKKLPDTVQQAKDL